MYRLRRGSTASIRRCSDIFIRRFNSKNNVKISSEVEQALNDRVPVVSLESTIITHGFPYPKNIEMARKVEQKIRDNGCVPATCAFIQGEPLVGLSDTQLQYLAEQKNANKVSRRDIGPTMAQKLNGGTTIAGTMILSHISGIKVFATGGLGGVHRDGHITMDISADLTELSRTPVTVVCAGPKLILDIPRTMEYLETQGVLVSTFNDDGRANIEVPSFFCRESGVRSPYSFTSWKEIAAVVHHLNNLMQLQSGNLLCIPPPAEIALSSELMSGIIDDANKEALQKGIHGKDLTPYLLQKIAHDTQGKSVECNMEFVINNADAASKIAIELMALEHNSRTSSFQPSTGLKHTRNKTIDSTILQQPKETKENTGSDTVDTLIVGLIALDTISRVSGSVVLEDSNPGILTANIGGVGFNVSLAHKFGLQSQDLKNNYRLVSAVGNDFAGRTVISQVHACGEDTSGIYVAKGQKTAQYSAIMDSKGDLVVAVADMSIMEDSSWEKHIAAQIKRGQPRFIVADCNLLSKILDSVISESKKLAIQPKIIIEPTSQPKLARINGLSSRNLSVFPNNSILMITPTAAELESIYASFSYRELFDDYDEWFPVLDSLGVNAQFRDRLESIALKNPVMSLLLKRGTPQQATQLLPYIPNILVKLGAEGCVLFRLSTDVTSYKSVPTTSDFKPTFTITSHGREVEDGKKLGVVIQHFAIPTENEGIAIVNTTGAGDSLLGYLSSALSNHDWLTLEIETLEQEWALWEAIHKAQLASGKTLKCAAATSEEIASIK